jgi:hypothetical protein
MLSIVLVIIIIMEKQNHFGVQAHSYQNWNESWKVTLRAKTVSHQLII